jgi:hypothetical protein
MTLSLGYAFLRLGRQQGSWHRSVSIPTWHGLDRITQGHRFLSAGFSVRRSNQQHLTRDLGGKGPEGKAEKASRLFECNLQAYNVRVRRALRPKFRTTTPFGIPGEIGMEGKVIKGPSTCEHNHICEPFLSPRRSLSETLIDDAL